MTDPLDVLRHQILAVCVGRCKAMVPLFAFSGEDLELLGSTGRLWDIRDCSIARGYNLV